LPIKIKIDSKPDGLTSYAGIPLFVETARVLGLPQLLERVFPDAAWRDYPRGTLAFCILIAIAAGAKSVEDVAFLRTDRGLICLLQMKAWPSATVIHRFLKKFHVLKTWQGGERGTAIVPDESRPLKVLDAINQALIKALSDRQEYSYATVDLDATIVESCKREALPHYDHGRGYQPWIAYWAETGLILTDEFRDGNVPADYRPLEQVIKAMNALPGSVKKRFFRADSALYSPKVVTWLDRNGIVFGISLPMFSELRPQIEALAETAWTRLRKPSNWGPIPTDLEIAEVEFVSNEMARSKDGRPFRILVVRRTDEQGRLPGMSRSILDEEGRRWHLALITNEWVGTPEHVWNWSRERCGTVEMAHAAMKNDLAAGVMPSGRFQANAAWYRLNVLTNNVLSAMKILALPRRMEQMRPATLRYRFLNLAGRVVRRGRDLILRLPWVLELVEIYQEARRRLWARGPCPVPG
jgi:hypothetical protein